MLGSFPVVFLALSSRTGVLLLSLSLSLSLCISHHFCCSFTLPTHPSSAFWGLAIVDSMVAIVLSLWAFKQIPTVAFCTSPSDACSCQGGGFEIYGPFCNASSIAAAAFAAAATAEGNATSSANDTTTDASVVVLKMAKEEYKGIFESLSGDTTIVFVSIGAVFLVILVFTFARVYIGYIKAGNAQVLAERAAARAREQNLKLKEELQATRLSKEQAAMVKENASSVTAKVPAHLQLHWKGRCHDTVSNCEPQQLTTPVIAPPPDPRGTVLKFLKRLGSGSFGDCFQGTKGERNVAIKRMRAGLAVSCW